MTFKSAGPVKKTSFALGRQGGVPLGGLLDFMLDPSRWPQEPSLNDVGSSLHGGMADPLTRHLSISEKTDTGYAGEIFFGVGLRFGRPVFSDRMKAEFLKDTHELRLRLAVKAERRRLSSALGGLADRLESVWGESRTPYARRRELLFELWDECLELLEPGPDAAQVDDDIVGGLVEQRERAAMEARRQILLFIRDRAPAGSPQGYPSEELRRFNLRRRSREAFAPYGDGATLPRPGP